MLGRHIIVELHGVDFELLDDIEFIERVLVEAATKAGATIIGKIFHKFKPHGVTGVVAVKESHISIHTWPELGYAALDIFTCRGIDPGVALEYIIEKLKPKAYIPIYMARGEPYTEEGVDESELPKEAIDASAWLTTLYRSQGDRVRNTL